MTCARARMLIHLAPSGTSWRVNLVAREHPAPQPIPENGHAVFIRHEAQRDG